MTIVELRNRQNALATRFQAITKAIDPIFGMKAMWTDTLANAAHEAWIACFSYREGYEHAEPPDYHSLVGAEHQIVHDDFLFPLVQDDIDSRNIFHHLKLIQVEAVTGIPFIPIQAGTPSTEGWLPDEIETVNRSYRRRITSATTRIRDINTNWKYLSAKRRRFPDFIKSSLMGMFGGADLGDFKYTEDDFKQPYSHDAVKQKPQVMSARWLAPFIGLEKALVIENAMEVIGEQSAPLPGEPPTLDGYSSHTSNAIKLFED